MFRERNLRADGTVIEAWFESPARFRLALLKDGGVLVEYRPGRRAVPGRSAGYEVRSVEQLRYDFERDAEDALRAG